MFAEALQDAYQMLILLVRMQCLWDVDAMPNCWTPSVDAAAMRLAVVAVRGMESFLRQLPADMPGVPVPGQELAELVNTRQWFTAPCAGRTTQKQRRLCSSSPSCFRPQHT